MASASSSAPVVAKAWGCAVARWVRDIRLSLRRLHSLSGIVPVGAFLFEHILISNSTAISGPACLRPPGQLSGESSAGVLPRIVRHLDADRVSRALRFLHLVSRRRECDFLSVERQLDVHGAALDRRDRVRLHPLAHVHHAIHRRRSARQSGASFGKVQHEVFQTPLFLFYVVGLIAASWHFAYGIWLFSAKWGIVSGTRRRSGSWRCAWRSSSC